MFRSAREENASPFKKAIYDLDDLEQYIVGQKSCYLVTPNNYGIDLKSVVRRLYDNETNPDEISKIHAEISKALNEAKEDCIDQTTDKYKNIYKEATGAYQRALLACENRTRLDTNYWGGMTDLAKIRSIYTCITTLATTYSQYEQVISQFNETAKTHEEMIQKCKKELEEKVERWAQRKKEKREREIKEHMIAEEKRNLLEAAHKLIIRMEPYTSKELVQTRIAATVFMALDDLKDHIKQLETELTDLKKYQDEQHAETIALALSKEQEEKAEAAKMRLIERGKGLISILKPQKSNTIDDLDKAAAKNDNLVSLTQVVNALAYEFETANLSRPVFFTPDKKSKSPWWGQGMHKPEKHEDQEQGRELLVYQDRSRKI
jgi:hypothetical protein